MTKKEYLKFIAETTMVVSPVVETRAIPLAKIFDENDYEWFVKNYESENSLFDMVGDFVYDNINWDTDIHFKHD